MKLGIMQPYFFPYIGYWQLINIVDKYVVYDDVNYIKGGWINRNRIIINDEVQYITIPLLKSSPYKKINEIKIDKTGIDKIINKIKEGYHKAPFFQDVFPVICNIMKQAEDDNIAVYLECVISAMCKLLNINTEIMISSDIDKDNMLKGEEKIIDICSRLKADEYINAIGGMGLYNDEKFNEHGICLSFLKSDDVVYRQFGEEFVGGLSIIDIMMFNSMNDVIKMLNSYTLVKRKEHMVCKIN